jgi:hypothetical protein
MALIRNSRERLDDVTRPGHKFDIRDPEAHIRRIAHFAAGLGADVTSTHPRFSSKTMSFGNAINISTNEPAGSVDSLTFSEHDEDHPFPEGIISGADARLHDMRAKGLLDKPKLIMASYELDNQRPFSHWNSTLLHPDAPNQRFNRIVDRDTSLIRGSISKAITPSQLGGSITLPTSINVDWGEANGGKSFRDAQQEARRKVFEFNQSRIIDPEIEATIGRALRNPLESGSGRGLVPTRLNDPEAFGPQFAKIKGILPGENMEDVIDFKSGTWAKISPEDYFPN